MDGRLSLSLSLSLSIYCYAPTSFPILGIILNYYSVYGSALPLENVVERPRNTLRTIYAGACETLLYQTSKSIITNRLSGVCCKPHQSRALTRSFESNDTSRPSPLGIQRIPALVQGFTAWKRILNLFVRLFNIH